MLTTPVKWTFLKAKLVPFEENICELKVQYYSEAPYLRKTVYLGMIYPERMQKTPVLWQQFDLSNIAKQDKLSIIRTKTPSPYTRRIIPPAGLLPAD